MSSNEKAGNTSKGQQSLKSYFGEDPSGSGSTSTSGQTSSSSSSGEKSSKAMGQASYTTKLFDVNTGGRLASRFDFSNFSDDRKSDSGYIDDFDSGIREVFVFNDDETLSASHKAAMFSPTISTFIAIVNECNWNSNLRINRIAKVAAANRTIQIIRNMWDHYQETFWQPSLVPPLQEFANGPVKVWEEAINARFPVVAEVEAITLPLSFGFLPNPQDVVSAPEIGVGQHGADVSAVYGQLARRAALLGKQTSVMQDGEMVFQEVQGLPSPSELVQIGKYMGSGMSKQGPDERIGQHKDALAHLKVFQNKLTKKKTPPATGSSTSYGAALHRHYLFAHGDPRFLLPNALANINSYATSPFKLTVTHFNPPSSPQAYPSRPIEKFFPVRVGAKAKVDREKGLVYSGEMLANLTTFSSVGVAVMARLRLGFGEAAINFVKRDKVVGLGGHHGGEGMNSKGGFARNREAQQQRGKNSAVQGQLKGWETTKPEEAQAAKVKGGVASGDSKRDVIVEELLAGTYRPTVTAASGNDTLELTMKQKLFFRRIKGSDYPTRHALLGFDVADLSNKNSAWAANARFFKNGKDLDTDADGSASSDKAIRLYTIHSCDGPKSFQQANPGFTAITLKAGNAIRDVIVETRSEEAAEALSKRQMTRAKRLDLKTWKESQSSELAKAIESKSVSSESGAGDDDELGSDDDGDSEEDDSIALAIDASWTKDLKGKGKGKA